jgi:hypothetical protein
VESPTLEDMMSVIVWCDGLRVGRRWEERSSVSGRYEE